MTVVAKSAIPLASLPVTSGTVAFTVIDTVKVIEHAVRRAGAKASALTVEQLDSAYDNLYLILTSMVNRGINLWCLEQVTLGLTPGKIRYSLPNGTVDIRNVALRSVTPLSAIWNNLAAVKTATLPTPAAVRYAGLRFATDGQYKLAFDYKNDAGEWTTVKTLTRYIGKNEWVWVDIDGAKSSVNFRVRETSGYAFYISDYVLAQNASELVLNPYNRDDYVAITNKNVAGRPLNYLYEKQLPPIISVWPVPDNMTDTLVLTRQRQVQDVGPLMAKLEIPERWFECIIWMLAKNLAYELPGIPVERIQLCATQADAMLREAELGESDGAPLRILPNISGYTR